MKSPKSSTSTNTNTRRSSYGLEDLEKRDGPLTIGEFLRSWRMCEDMTQADFAKLLGLSVQNMCDIEKGRQLLSPRKAYEISSIIEYPAKVLVELAVNDELRSYGIKLKAKVDVA